MSDHLPPPPADVRRSAAPAPAQSLGTPADFRRGGNAVGGNGSSGEDAPAADAELTPSQPGAKRQATETLAQRAGALSDEIDFPAFVASLIHGTFDAIVDASIRQMESYSDLVSAVAKTTEQFTEENVSLNQARDWLVQQFPQDLALDLAGSPRVVPKLRDGDDPDEPRSPEWLEQFQLGGEELTPELIEEQLVPRARTNVGQGRQQLLATMVLLGLNRVVVRDGSISARLRFRASAADHAKVEYAVSDDPQAGSGWGNRGGSGYALPSTKVSTVGVNVQSDSDLKAELFGEVKINFASETLPLDRFADEARRTLLERRAKSSASAAAAPQPQPVPQPQPPAPQPPAPAPELPKGTP
jgi:hypothetical protein